MCRRCSSVPELLVQPSAGTGVFPWLVFPGTCPWTTTGSALAYHCVYCFWPLSNALSLLSSSLLPSLSLSRLRAGDGDVPPAPQLHPQPRGRLLLRLRGRPRDRPRVSDRDRAITLQMLDPRSFLHPFLPKRLGAKPWPVGNLARWLFPTGWAWSTMAKATGAPTRPAWAASWHRWCRLPSTATTGPAAASRSSTATSSRST